MNINNQTIKSDYITLNINDYTYILISYVTYHKRGVTDKIVTNFSRNEGSLSKAIEKHLLKLQTYSVPPYAVITIEEGVTILNRRNLKTVASDAMALYAYARTV